MARLAGSGLYKLLLLADFKVLVQVRGNNTSQKEKAGQERKHQADQDLVSVLSMQLQGLD